METLLLDPYMFNCGDKQERVSNTIECWFSDMQKMLDNPNQSEKKSLSLLLLVCAANYIYRRPNGLKDAEYSSNKINRNIREFIQLVNECKSLRDAEGQQRAFERQLSTCKADNSFERAYWKLDLPEEFFSGIYRLKQKHYPHIADAPEGVWVKKYRSFWEKCRCQPIASMLLPILFTSLIVNGNETLSAYAYLKQKKSGLSVLDKRNVIELYREVRQLFYDTVAPIHQVTENWKEELGESIEKNPTRVAYSPFLPVFNWEEITKEFCAFHQLGKTDSERVEQIFNQYRGKNGLSKREEKELAKLPYGEHVRAVAKLCNINVWLMLKCGTPVPSKAKKPLALLMQGDLLPANREIISNQDFGAYLDRYCVESDLTYLALVRYYHVPLEQDFDLTPLGIASIEEEFELVSSVYIGEICKQFKDAQYLATSTCRLWENPMDVLYLVRSKKFASEIARNFTRVDYVDFLSDTEYFRYTKFSEYLTAFCDKYNLSHYKTIHLDEKIYWEYEALTTMLQMVQAYLKESFMRYWQDTLTELLYS